MSKQYNVTTRSITARPRSKRLRELGVSGDITVTGSSSSGVLSSPDGSSSGNGHTHQNKALLDSLSMTDDMYLLSTEWNDETEVTEELKIKAGYADEAGTASEAGHATEADHAKKADEAEHAKESDHSKDSDTWEKHKFADWLAQPVRTTDDVKFKSATVEALTATVKALIEELAVNGDSVFGGRLSSKEFVSGFLTGKGWAVFSKTVQNAFGKDETKWCAEVDELTVRGSMKVYEIIISQLLGENDNRIFTGMMEVDHYDASSGRIYLSTENGKLYNPFRKDDYILVQQYTGVSGEVTKSYELIVTDAGCGSTEDAENRLDWVTFKNFTATDGTASTLITKGDTLVRVDNASDSDRKGIMQINSVGSATPYLDVIYGMKTDPDNYLKGRMGNISGIYHHLFGWLEGFGEYLTNLYAVGDFRLKRTGESIEAKIEALEGMLTSQIQRMRYDLTEDDNYLKNASFSESMYGWTVKGSDISIITSNDEALLMNGNTYNDGLHMAVIESYDGKNMLHLKDCEIIQENSLITKPSTHKEYSIDADGNESENEVKDMLYLSLKILPLSDGQLTIGFNGSSVDENSLPSAALVSLKSSNDWQTLQWEGTWDDIGDFHLKYTGNAYISILSLTGKPLDEYKKETSTKFEQTDEMIRFQATKIKGSADEIINLWIDVNANSESITAHAERIGQNETDISELRIDADSISATVTGVKDDLETALKYIAAVAQLAGSAITTEEYTQDTNPWNSWASGTEYKHIGALWHNTADGKIYRYVGYNNNSTWVDVTDEVAAISYVNQTKDKITTVVAQFDSDGNPVESSGLATTAWMNQLISQYFDSAGKLKNTSGLITTSNYAELMSQYFNTDGTLINKSGLLVEADMTEMFSRYFDSDGKLIKTSGLLTTADATKIYATKYDMSGTISATAEELKLELVSKENIVAAINMTEEEIKINAKKINLNGAVTANENFKVLEDGSVSTKNMTLSGALYQPFVFVEDSDALAYPIAAGDYEEYFDESEGYTEANVEANHKAFSEGEDGYILGLRPHFTDEQIENSKLDPDDENYEALPSYAKWFNTTPSYSESDFTTAIQSWLTQDSPKLYGVYTAYKINSQFQLDVTWQTVVLPSDSKYVGCRVMLFNTNFATTRSPFYWNTVVVADVGCKINRECVSYNAIAFRGGTVELMMVQEHANSYSQNEARRYWIILDSKCKEVVYTSAIKD